MLPLKMIDVKKTITFESFSSKHLSIMNTRYQLRTLMYHNRNVAGCVIANMSIDKYNSYFFSRHS